MNKHPLTKNEVNILLKKISIENIESEKIELLLAEGRIISSDIISSIDLPPFNNSAVDGYAIHNDNLNDSMKLKCAQRVAAGDQAEIIIKANEVVRIFTGARMPNNCNTVIMQENTIVDGDYISMRKIPHLGENCRLKGEDVSKGDKILQCGEKINSTNINLIAAVGKKYVEVKKKLKVGYFTSGNELVEPSERLGGSKINNSNRYSLQSLLNDSYIVSHYLGILRDSKDKIIESLTENINDYNVIITTGGASVGEEDHLIDVIKEKGRIFFWKTAIKPGRPLAIGQINKTIIICLPGNPVSVHLLYGLIIKPFLEFLCGSKMNKPKSFKAIVNFSMKKKTNRLEWIRVTLDQGNSDNVCVNKYQKQGSGMISSIAFSDGIIEIPENVSKINKGDKFDFYLFDELFN